MSTFLISGGFWSIPLWILLCIIMTYFVTYYLVYLRQIKRWKQSNIPFLQPTFLIGHKYFLSAAKYPTAIPLNQIYKENAGKELIGFFLGTIPMIMLKDQKLIRQVFAKHSRQTFATGFTLPESEVEAQYSIAFTENAEKWKFVRNLMIPIFSAAWFQGPRFERIKEMIHDLWQDFEKLESDGSPLNVKEVTGNAILNIASSNFGIDSRSHAMKDGLRTIIADFFEPSFHRQLCFFSVSVFPFLQMFESFKIFPRKICNIMSEILKHQINQRDQINVETGDVIDILRSLRTEPESKISVNKGSDLFSIREEGPTREMTGIGIGLVLAASDTVQGPLRFAIHSLSLHPEYQRKIRREVLEAMKKHGVSEFTFEIIQSLSFTIRCLYEAARLYPVTIMMRQCSEDFQIPGTNYILRKGDKVMLPLYSISRDEMHFKNPHAFDPERFDCKNANFAVPETLLTFGLGPRKCAGYAHGIFVSAAILASLLYKYEIKPRSHQKLMDAYDFNSKALSAAPRRDIFVDLVRCDE